jgi:hypothetical protein
MARSCSVWECGGGTHLGRRVAAEPTRNAHPFPLDQQYLEAPY